MRNVNSFFHSTLADVPSVGEHYRVTKWSRSIIDNSIIELRSIMI